MGMFFKKKRKENLKLEGKESVFSSEDIIKDAVSSSEEEIHPELSFHPDWNLSEEDMYAFRFLNLECPPLKPNQLSLSGINMVRQEDGFSFNAFIRHSLNKTIKLGETKLVLLDENDKLLGRKTFDLSQVGEFPPNSSRPWAFLFTEKDLFTTDIPQEGWKIAFQLTSKHRLDLDKSWEKSLPEKEKQKLKEMVEKIDPPKEGEVNFLGLQAKYREDGGLQITMLIRNGSEKNVNIEQIPLQVEDAAGDIVAKGGFKLEKFEVKANTSKPWSFIFPAEMVTKSDADFSRWKAYPPQQ